LGNDGKKVCIWDVEKSVNALSVAGKTPFHSFSWKSDGSLLATSGKGVVEVWDSRAEQASLSVYNITMMNHLDLHSIYNSLIYFWVY
jgi:coronin-7